jgi:hypothetical protein
MPVPLVDTAVRKYLPLAAVAGEDKPPAGVDAAAPHVPDLCGKSHPVVEYSGYTWTYLPELCVAPLCAKAKEAILAILAARIAFSNFPMRSLLKYAPKACSSACSRLSMLLFCAKPGIF